MGTERAGSGLEFWDIKPQTIPRSAFPIFPELVRAGRYPVPFCCAVLQREMRTVTFVEQ